MRPVLADRQNDLTFIFLQVDADSLPSLLRLQELRLSAPLPDEDEMLALCSSDNHRKYARLLRRLRQTCYSVDRRPVMFDQYGRTHHRYKFALLRYAAHALSFDEPTPLQLEYAGHCCLRLCQDIRTLVDQHST